MLKTLRRIYRSIGFAAFVGAVVLSACASRQEDTGTETHWLKTCDSDADCNGPTSCLCGLCTIECEDDDSCPDQAPQCLASNGDSCGGGASTSICLSDERDVAEADAAPVRPQVPDSDQPFSWNSYVEVMCKLYTSCSPELQRAYGTRERCLAYVQQLYELDTTRLPDFSAPGWDAECLAGFTRLDCPQGEDSGDDYVVQQHLANALFSCANPQAMACNDNDDCFDVWECSATDGMCGSCQRPTPGTCRLNLDCSNGDYCIDGVCGPGKLEGSECSGQQECVSERCDGVCLAPTPEGGRCNETIDCATYLWCDQGVCSAPAAPGEPCVDDNDTDKTASCQFGYVCTDGSCQELGFSDVALGEACLSSGVCVAGAECVGSVCVPTEDACVDDNQCPEGQYCDTECLPKLADGEECRDTGACISGYCSDDNVCADGNPCD